MLPSMRRFRLIARLSREREGTTALEMCLLFPFMMVLFFGTYETTQLVRVFMGLGMATQGMADLLSHGDPDTAAQILDSCNGAKLMMTPFASTTFKAAISSVKNTAGTITVSWSDTSCGTATGIPSQTAITMGTPMVPNTGDEVFIVQSQYTYAAATSYVLPASYTLAYQAFVRPRVPGS